MIMRLKPTINLPNDLNEERSFYEDEIQTFFLFLGITDAEFERKRW